MLEPRRDSIANSQKLSNLEEEKLVEYILGPDSRGFSPWISGVEDFRNP
jgi:hypothetical protein